MLPCRCRGVLWTPGVPWKSSSTTLLARLSPLALYCCLFCPSLGAATGRSKPPPPVPGIPIDSNSLDIPRSVSILSEAIHISCMGASEVPILSLPMPSRSRRTHRLRRVSNRSGDSVPHTRVSRLSKPGPMNIESRESRVTADIK